MSGVDARSWVTGLVWSKGRGNVCSAEGSRAGVLWAGCGGDSWAGGIWVQEKGVPGQGSRTGGCGRSECQMVGVGRPLPTHAH